MNGIGWTEEESEQAKTLWQQGVSASKIGVQVGKTKNAVLTKLHRMNLDRDDKPADNVEWTDEQFELAKKLWQEGNSARTIALEVGKTKSAVLSKLHRTGNHERAQPDYLKSYFRPENAGRKLAPRVMPVVDAPIDPPVPEPNPIRGVTIYRLKRNSCRFPLSDDPQKTPPSKFLYCGARITHGAYCEVHAQLAYIPIRGRSPEREMMRMITASAPAVQDEKLLDKDVA